MSEFTKPNTVFGDEIRFTPYAWAKLLWMRDRGETEVAGYGVTGTDDPLLVTDFVLVKQQCTSVTFDLDAEDGAEYMERMMDNGLVPWQYANLLIHTHPGASPTPSGVDEDNFKSAFTHPDWAIMFIIAEGGACYCRLKINVGPGCISELKVSVDWKCSFAGTDSKAWEQEYKAKVTECKLNKFVHVKSQYESKDYNPFQIDEELDYNEQKWDNLEKTKWDDVDRGCPTAEEIDDVINFDCHWTDDGYVAFWEDDTSTWYFFNPVDKKWFWQPEHADDCLSIAEPEEEWVKSVMHWACVFADERQIMMEQ